MNYNVGGSQRYTLREMLGWCTGEQVPVEFRYLIPHFEPGQQQQTGRPTLYSPEWGKEICLARAECSNSTAVCEQFNLSRATLWRWRRDHPEFRLMWSVANQAREKLSEQYPEIWGKNAQRDHRVMKRFSRRLFSPTNKRFRRRGRPTKYRSEYCARVAPTLDETANDLGVTKRTVINWCKEHREFAFQIELERQRKWLSSECLSI